jgi:hypothetical protein
MATPIENIVLVAASLPGLYGFLCWVRRNINAQRTAAWIKATHREEWNSLHWLAKRNSWAGIEVLIKKELISGPEVCVFRARDEYLEKATWVGLFISALLLLFIIILKGVIAIVN